MIVSTISHLVQTPSLASIVAPKIGAPTAAAFDISAACAGFSYGLAQAEALVRSGAAHHVVVVGVETLSTITDMTDRSTAFLFSDGAGAAVVGPSEVNGIGPVVWGSDGTQADAIEMSRDWQGPLTRANPLRSPCRDRLSSAGRPGSLRRPPGAPGRRRRGPRGP